MSYPFNIFNINFANPSAMCHEIDAIARLAHINASLGEDPKVRRIALEHMDKLSKSLLKISEELSESRTINRASFAKIIGNLDVVYLDLNTAELTAETIKKISQSIQNDIQALAVVPIRKPNLGIHGPTFLVNYHRSSENTDPLFCSFVIKKTDYIETISNRIYHEFVSCCEQKIGKNLLGSPNIATIDLTAKSYQNPVGQTSPLPTNEHALLLNAFSTIARATKSNLGSLSTVMLAEKVQGQNLLDFLTSERYAKASIQQKANFFFKVGLLSMLDLVIGNFERFIAIETDIPNFLSNDLPANLGNALIVLGNTADSDEHFGLVAIDNGIAPMLTKQSDERLEWSAENIRKQYCAFLQQVLSNPEGIELLLDNIIQSFKISPTVIKSQNITKLLETFLQDLENLEFCRNNLREGLRQMGILLKKIIIPYWNSPESANLKVAIRQNFPASLEPLDERLNLVDKCFF